MINRMIAGSSKTEEASVLEQPKAARQGPRIRDKAPARGRSADDGRRKDAEARPVPAGPTSAPAVRLIVLVPAPAARPGSVPERDPAPGRAGKARALSAVPNEFVFKTQQVELLFAPAQDQVAPV
ncbi:hypothetical protein MBH78_16755 [Oceanimonas sp. NS1]|nr:hypothetical protein [Oceanimonas sp. NS1]